MSETFFIADTHFGHKNIIEYQKKERAFASIEDHDAELIKRWNSRVTKNDTVWVLGDFCLSRKRLDIAGQLNGKKNLVLGNHDFYPTEDYLLYFDKLYGAVSMYNLILTHIPVHEEQLTRRYEYNLHGHLHSYRVMCKTYKQKIDARYVNVSVEQINLTPITLDELGVEIKKRSKDVEISI